ncbi:TPA: hypothetical protein DIU27_00215 [Candidatus Collierbacteria bacterium]|uniref:Uncharacterized protein n=1 Tax=Candidatus Collierbacteria bacterium GW2011_GWB2_44_22 TaxID=1618387 RepID=A0A0G1KWV9_9BACT|nr:MAG: hypothetical protein UW31_C0004G0009 [Candidatus Collierbacteria bacterium GW2011_GWA2_44_13]KKT51413.1 MAG: hypothetical protein UW42_C0003G0026 [Candidatus Collierbacteria bacterium GW2011_GWB1_44_197]KKT52419.1 MAG: hypothetical protein UW44_C0002G0085 [Candidatus Collierbacteria bacterium GW2011_GWB2_44_22]KKT62871.1 MAG: hypothetical protein UW56_C0003G0057 [Candidatus Collierbacteria bacterium GW2011_GWD1_44_27]KKT66270.1 MAG: hypothetical protein UW58_C0011G0041 [Candidatus Colli
MATSYDRELTVNFLGYIHCGQAVCYLSSETGVGMLYLNNSEIKELVKVIIIGKNDFVEHREVGPLTISFKDGNVTIDWTNCKDGKETATFEEIQLVKVLDIDSVRDLVLNRRAA